MKESITITEFKTKCHQILNEVQTKRKAVTLTKRGKAVAQIVPVEDETSSIFGRLKGTVTILGDIISPLDEKWEAETGESLVRSGSPSNQG